MVKRSTIHVAGALEIKGIEKWGRAYLKRLVEIFQNHKKITFSRSAIKLQLYQGIKGTTICIT